MSSPIEEPTAVLVMSIFPVGEPGKIRLNLNQRGKVKLTRDEALWLLNQAAVILRADELPEEFPEQL